MFSGPLPNQLLPNVSTVPLAEPGAPVFSASPKAVSEKRCITEVLPARCRITIELWLSTSDKDTIGAG
jgi:hypothetical protein